MLFVAQSIYVCIKFLKNNNKNKTFGYSILNIV